MWAGRRLYQRDNRTGVPAAKCQRWHFYSCSTVHSIAEFGKYEKFGRELAERNFGWLKGLEYICAFFIRPISEYKRLLQKGGCKRKCSSGGARVRAIL